SRAHPGDANLVRSTVGSAFRRAHATPDRAADLARRLVLDPPRAALRHRRIETGPAQPRASVSDCDRTVVLVAGAGGHTERRPYPRAARIRVRRVRLILVPRARP